MFKKKYQIMYCKKQRFCQIKAGYGHHSGNRETMIIWKDWNQAPKFRTKWNAEHYAYKLAEEYKRLQFRVVKN